MSKERSKTRLSPEVMVQAIANLQNEGLYVAGGPFTDSMEIENVVKLSGVDFAAGDAARAAVESGFDPKRIVEFFIIELVPMVRGWHRQRCPPQPTSDQECEFGKQNAKSRVDALKAIGLARSVLAGELNLSSEFDYEEAAARTADADELVRAAESVASYAADVIAAEMDPGETAEMSTRGMMRALKEAAKMGSRPYDVAGMLERLRALVADQPATRKRARS